ncbi:MAG: menaquinone biosynthesis protein [Bacteroidota bacterium]
MKKIKVTAVSYLNTKPLIYGLIQHPVFEKIELQTDIPAVCADKLIQNEVDLALVPVAAIPKIASPYLISDYCIGTEGAVKTVCIFAEQPIENLTDIYLDFHSRTSVELTKILLQHYWKLKPNLWNSEEGYIQKIGGTTGALVIGDRAIGLEQQYPFVYDLGEIWEQYTGLPFVFAAWVSNKALSPTFIKEFNEALAYGLERIPELKLLLPLPNQQFDLEAYFTKYIKYHLDDQKKEALTLFLKHLKTELPSSIPASLPSI